MRAETKMAASPGTCRVRPHVCFDRKSTHPVTAALTLSDAHICGSRLNLLRDPLRIELTVDICPIMWQLDALANDSLAFLACITPSPEGEITARPRPGPNALYLSVLTLGGHAARDREVWSEGRRRPLYKWCSMAISTDRCRGEGTPLAPSLVSSDGWTSSNDGAPRRIQNKNPMLSLLAPWSVLLCFPVSRLGGYGAESMERCRASRAQQHSCRCAVFRQILQIHVGQRGNGHPARQCDDLCWLVLPVHVLSSGFAMDRDVL